jgi:hypothetical protein
MWQTILFGIIIGLIILFIIRVSEISTRMKTFEAFILTAVTNDDLSQAIKAFEENRDEKQN